MIHLRWTRYHWPIILTLLLGIITATGLAAAGPVLVDQVLTFAFRRVLLNAPVGESHLLLTQREQVDEEGFLELDNIIQSTLDSHFQPIPHTNIRSGTLPTLIPWQDERLLTSQRLNVRFYGDDIQDHVTVIAGAWPTVELWDVNGNPLSVIGNQSSDDVLPITDYPTVIAAVIGEPLAQAYTLGVGDRLPLSKQVNAVEPEVWLEVAAIVQPMDGQDPFWFGELSPLRVRDDGRSLHYSALISRDTFFTLAATQFLDQTPGFAWPVLIDEGALTLAHIPLLQERLTSLPDQLFQIDPQLQLDSDLLVTVNNFAEQADDVRTPLTFLTATTALLAFFFVAMAAALAAVRMQGEWDLMRSRGITPSHLVIQQFVRSLALIVPAILLGALLAGLLLRGLALVGPLADVREPGWSVAWPKAAWTAVFIAAAACILVLLWPFVGLSRQPIASRLQTVYRPDNAGWWQRYYVDVILVLVGLILLGRFVAGGGLIATQEIGDGADWLLVLAPIATMFGGLAILLRLFPPLLNALSHLVGRGRQSTPFWALAYSARSHQQATRLVLLFALTVALGIFAASVDDALNVNEVARAQYATGGKVRLVGVNTTVSHPTNQTTSVVWRGEGSFNSAMNGRYPIFNVLAIEPDSFRQVANLRDDFASEPITSLVQRLQPPDSVTGNSIPIPQQAKRLGLWLSMPTDNAEHWQGISLDVKVADVEGNVSLLPLAPTGAIEGSWRRFETALPSPPPRDFKSIWLRSRTYRPEFRQNLAYDAVTVVDDKGQEILLEGFEASGEPHRFWFRANLENTSNFYFASGQEPFSGNIKLEFTFGTASINPGEWYGVVPFDQTEFSAVLLPALVSRDYAALTGVSVNDQMLVRVRQSAVSAQPVLIKIVGIVDYFPTLYNEAEGGYMITLRDPLLTLFNNSRHDAIQPNELLLAAAPPVEIANQAAQVIEVTAVQRTLRAFPLAVGLRSASLLSYILATVISLGGFAAHLVFIVSQRRNQFAVMRAIGLDNNQLYALLFIEQLVLVFSGLLLGTGLGILLAWLTLNNLNFDWGGLAAAPPFVAVWDWQALLQTYGLFAVTVLVGLATAVLIIRRTGLQRALSMVVD